MGRTSIHPLAVVVLLAAGAPGCGDAGTPVRTEAPEHEAAGTEAAGTGLQLNDGHKWQMGPHMLAPVRRMQARLAAASPQETATTGAAAQLADSLFADMDELVQACDMKGKGHDVLHAWLMPHMSLLQRLERASQADSVALVLGELERSNALFDQYFE